VSLLLLLLLLLLPLPSPLLLLLLLLLLLPVSSAAAALDAAAFITSSCQGHSHHTSAITSTSMARFATFMATSWSPCQATAGQA
jgi:hypothetical protein